MRSGLAWNRLSLRLKKTMKNKLNDNLVTVGRLAGAIQDMYHYVIIIIPGNGHWSTFEGEREYMGLAGRFRAYSDLKAKVETLMLDSLPAFCELNLPEIENIASVDQLVAAGKEAMRAIIQVASENNIDPHSGELKREYILVDSFGAIRESRMLTKDEEADLNRGLLQNGQVVSSWWALNVTKKD